MSLFWALSVEREGWNRGDESPGPEWLWLHRRGQEQIYGPTTSNNTTPPNHQQQKTKTKSKAKPHQPTDQKFFLKPSNTANDNSNNNNVSSGIINTAFAAVCFHLAPAFLSAALQPLCPAMNKPDGAFSQRTTMEVGVGNPAPKYPVHNFIPSYPTCQLYPTAELSSEIRQAEQKQPDASEMCLQSLETN